MIISNDKNEVPMLTGDNDKEWKDRVFFHLSVPDLDYVLCRDGPAELTNISTLDEIILYE